MKCFTLTGIESLLKRTKTFMSRSGMKINPRKSNLIGLKEVGSKKQLFIVTEPFLRMEISIFARWGLATPPDIWASSSAPEELEKSLRSKVTTCLVGSALKPKQKIEFIQSFILPRWRHGLAFGRISIETYQKLDRRVRRAVCKILHSPDGGIASRVRKQAMHMHRQRRPPACSLAKRAWSLRHSNQCPMGYRDTL